MSLGLGRGARKAATACCKFLRDFVFVIVPGVLKLLLFERDFFLKATEKGGIDSVDNRPQERQ